MFVLAYEILFVLLTAGLFLALGDVLDFIGDSLVSANPVLIQQQSTEALRAFFVNSILAIIGTLVCVFILYVIFQWFGWKTVVKKPAKFWKFFLLNLIWLASWLVFDWFIIIGLRGVYAVIGVTILASAFLHLTGILHRTYVAGETQIGKAISKTFAIGFGKIHKFVLPYALAVIVFVVWSQVWILSPVDSTGGFALISLFCVVFAPFLAWYKFYLNRILDII